MPYQNLSHQTPASNTLQSGLASADSTLTPPMEQNTSTTLTNPQNSTSNQLPTALTDIIWQQILVWLVNVS